MNPPTTKPIELFELLAGALGGTVALVVVAAVAVGILILWMMWVILPFIVYSQLNSVQRLLLQLHGDLVEVNCRLAERGPNGLPIPPSRGAPQENPIRG